MKLDAKTVASLTLGDKGDVIHFDSELRGFGFRLRRAASGNVLRSWIVQYRASGRGHRYLVGDAAVLSAEVARTEAKKVLAKVALGQDPQSDRTDRRDKDKLSFSSVVEDFLAAKKPNVRPRTLFQLQRYLQGERYLKAFHALPLDAISKRDVAARILRITNESGPAQAREVRSTLSSFYTWCMRMGLTEHNPTIGTERPVCNEPRARVLDDIELARVWNACDGDSEYHRIIRMLVLTGCRRAEVGDMCWSEFDNPEHPTTWTIPASRSKNHRAHTLPVLGAMREIILSTPRMASRDALFGRRGPGFSAWSWEPNKPALDERSGVKNWRVHDLRRSVASGMQRLGIRTEAIERVLGHVSGSFRGIVGIYQRDPLEGEVRVALQRWANHIQGLTSGEPSTVTELDSVRQTG